MEYQLRIMADGVGNGSPRPLDPAHPFAPCDSVLPIDRPACLFETPTWWLSSLGTRSQEQFQKFGVWCGSLDGPERQACVEGSGFWIASLLDFDVNGILNACNAISGGNAKARLSCLSSAARRFRAMQRPDVDTICVRFGLTGDALAYCNEFAHSTPTQNWTFPQSL